MNRNFEKSELEHLNKYLNNSIKNIKYYSKIKQTKRFFNDLKVVDFELLKEIAKHNLEIFLSTGMATLGEIEVITVNFITSGAITSAI